MSEHEPLTDMAFAAESGDASAQYRLGVLFLTGYQVDQDLKAARRWFQAASANGSRPAEAMVRTTSQARPNLPISAKYGPILVFGLPLLALLSLSVHTGYQYSRWIHGSTTIHAQGSSAPNQATAQVAVIPAVSLANANESIAKTTPPAKEAASGDFAAIRHHSKGRRRK